MITGKTSRNQVGLSFGSIADQTNTTVRIATHASCVYIGRLIRFFNGSATACRLIYGPS